MDMLECQNPGTQKKKEEKKKRFQEDKKYFPVAIFCAKLLKFHAKISQALCQPKKIPCIILVSN